MTEALFDFLQLHGIRFTRVDHPAAFTTEAAESLVPPMPGAKAKSLFLRDGRGERLLLVVVPFAKRVDVAALARALGLRKLSFASAEQLRACLGVSAGSVSVLALLNDREVQVTLVIDEVIWQAEGLQCHPMINTATLSVPAAGLRRFLQATGHAPQVLNVPARAG